MGVELGAGRGEHFRLESGPGSHYRCPMRLTLFLACAALAASCRKPDAPAGSAQQPRAAVEVRDAGTVKPEEAFKVELVAPASVGPGTSQLLVGITARTGYHLNAEYPHNFRVDRTSAGIQLAPRNELKDPLERTACADFPDDACSAKFAVPFEATTNGVQRIEGTLALSVCNPSICLIERVPLSADVEVR